MSRARLLESGLVLALACGGSAVQDEGAETTSGSSTEGEGDGDGETTTTSETGESEETGPDGGSPGCGNAAAEVGVFETVVQIAGVDREVLIAVPEDYDPDTAYRLVFAWHARGTTPAIARGYYGIETHAAGTAIVVYPAGLPIASMGNQTGWDLNPNGVDVQLFDALHQGFLDTYCVDVDRVFSVGHSFGGYMSNTLGCARAELVRAIAPVAGGGPYGGCGPGPLAAWLTHGESDGTVPFSEGEASRDHWLSVNGCGETTTPVEPGACVRYDGCPDGYPVVWCPHQETALDGHGWPSFASAAIWEFFAGF